MHHFIKYDWPVNQTIDDTKFGTKLKTKQREQIYFRLAGSGLGKANVVTDGGMEDFRFLAYVAEDTPSEASETKVANINVVYQDTTCRWLVETFQKRKDG